jgi:hypothetical protein
MLSSLGEVGKRERYMLLRRFGYGVPSYERAAASASNHLALVAQNNITPFRSSGGRKFRDCHFYRLPWPKEVLESIGERDVRLKITLSYFIDPLLTHNAISRTACALICAASSKRLRSFWSASIP